MSPSTSSASSPTSEVTFKSDYERLNSITTSDSRSSKSSVKFDRGVEKGGEIEMQIQQTQSTPEFTQRERSPTPSMLMRRRTEGEAARRELNGPNSAGFVEGKRDRRMEFEEGGKGEIGRERQRQREKGKGGKKGGSAIKRRHSSNEHANVYTE